MRFSCLLLCLVLLSNTISSQCTLACNDELQLNLDQSGNFLVTPNLLQQGNIANCPNLGVELYDNNNNFIGDVLTCAQAGTVVTGRLINYDNNVFCDTDLFVFDNFSPVFTCIDTFVMCNAAVTPFDIGYPLVTDNCKVFQNSDLQFSDVLYNLPCFETVNGISVTARIERTWLAMDDSGNQGNCVQTIYLTKPTLSDVEFPSHFSGSDALTCGIGDANDFTLTGVPIIDGNPIDPNGLCDISILHDDQVFNTCGGGTTTIRSWVALDVCNNTILEFDQIIEVKDNIAPEIMCPADLTVSANSFSCAANTFTIPNIEVSDECSSFTVTPSWAYGTGFGPFTDIPVGQHSLTYTATDACGNSSTCTINVNIIDDTPPTPVCEDGINVSLLPTGLARVFASTFDEGSFDNCGLDRFEVSRDSEPFGDFIELSCDDIGGLPVIVHFRAYDLNGLFNECTISVTVRDNFRPSITCPSAVMIDCEVDDIMDLSVTGQPTVSDACGIDTMYFEDVSSVDCGTGTILREWTVVDVHGNSESCTQTIEVEDNAVLSIQFPGDVVVDFSTGGTGTSQTGAPIISGEGCKNILTNFADQNFTSSSYCYSIIRTWTVINDCEYDPNSGSNAGLYTQAQRIDVIDNASPILTCPSDTLVLNLSNNCTSSFINISLPSATDISGETFIENNSPFALSSDEDASGFYPNGIHNIEYTAYDNCGNSSKCVQVVEVIDGLGPNLICNNNIIVEMTAGGSVSLDPSLFVASVSDNCTPASQLDYQLFPNTFDCEDIGFQAVRLTVTDADGNQAICNALVEVQDNMFGCSAAEVDINGAILNPLGTPIEGIEVSANGIYFTHTDANGNYTFENLPAGQDYRIFAIDEPLEQNGISSFDLVLLSAHILQTRTIENPYTLIGGDADSDNSISVFDLLNIRQLILEVITSYSSDIAWKCIDANFEFTDISNPFLDNYPLEINFTQLNTNIQNADFVAVKLGDADLSAVNFDGVDVSERSNLKTNILFVNQILQAGSTQEIELSLEDRIQSLGMQFEILLDPEYVDFVSLLSGDQIDINNNNFRYNAATNSLKFSWNTQSSAIDLVEEAPVLKLKVNMHKEAKPSEFIKISQKNLSPEMYNQGFEKIELGVAFYDVKVEDESSTLFVLEQNYPNPVVNSAVIQINSPADMEAQLLFTTIDGKKSLLKQIQLQEGENLVTIYTEEFQIQSDVQFYTLITEEGIIDSKKMVFE